MIASLSRGTLFGSHIKASSAENSMSSSGITLAISAFTCSRHCSEKVVGLCANTGEGVWLREHG